jgi:hypothetical protein
LSRIGGTVWFLFSENVVTSPALLAILGETFLAEVLFMRVRKILMAAFLMAALSASPALAKPEIEPMPKVKWGPGGTCDFVPAGFTPMEKSNGRSEVECGVFEG